MAPRGKKEAVERDPWSADRWAWVEAVCLDPGLSAMARLLAYRLITRPKDIPGPFYQTNIDQIAAAVLESERTVQRALRQLREGGWIMTGGVGAGSRLTIQFVMPGRANGDKSVTNNHDKTVTISAGIDDKSVTNRPAKLVTDFAENGDRFVVPPTPPIKTPISFPTNAGASGRETKPVSRAAEAQNAEKAQDIARRLLDGERIPPFMVTKPEAQTIVALGLITADELWRQWQIDC